MPPVFHPDLVGFLEFLAHFVAGLYSLAYVQVHCFTVSRGLLANHGNFLRRTGLLVSHFALDARKQIFDLLTKRGVLDSGFCSGEAGSLKLEQLPV